MKVKPPAARRKFAEPSEEIGYLYNKLVYWLYQRQDVRHARRFAHRLEHLMKKADQQSIFAEECRSLVAEAHGEIAKAIQHRENEILLIRRLHELSRNTANADVVLRQYGYTDLSDRLDLLAVLYHDSGDLDKALSSLQESKRLCEKHGVRFDGEDLFQDYLKEKKGHVPNPGTVV